jgi:hypothetical protein
MVNRSAQVGKVKIGESGGISCDVAARLGMMRMKAGEVT